MARNRKPPSRDANAAAEPEKLLLTKQQAASVLASQQAASLAREQANTVLRGVLDAAGIDNADVTGGELAIDKPFLTIKRKA